MMGFIRKIVVMAIPMAMVGCVTTTTGPGEPKKWEPEERAQAHVDLGMTYLSRNQYETAQTEFDIALQINPQSDTAYHAVALLNTRLDNNDEATRAFAKAVSLNNSNYSAVNDYGIHLCQQGKVSDGIRELSRIETENANDQVLATRLGLGICYFRGGSYAQSETYLRFVLDQSPTIPQALLPMAEISFIAENHLSARAFLERYFGTGAVTERSLYLATKVEHQLGDLNKANQYRRELKRRYPQSILTPELETLLAE